MSYGPALKALARVDAVGVVRDPFLRWLSLVAVGLALGMRFGIPALSEWLAREHQFDLTPFYVLLMSLNLAMAPMLAGMVIGFLLLDQKDDQTLSALRITPLGLRGYLAYRIASSMVVSTALTIIVMLVAGLTPIELWPLALMAVGIAPLAPFFALFLAAFAANKVQGMALTKANGFLTMPPLVAWFVHGPWHWALGIVPTFWPVKAFWIYSAGEPGWVWYILSGFIYLAVCSWLMMRRFKTAATR